MSVSYGQLSCPLVNLSMFAQSFEMSPFVSRQCISRPPEQLDFTRVNKATISLSISQSDCQNYPRVFSRLDNDTRFLLCGTNAFSPRCRFYFKANPWSRNLVLEKEFSGRGFCPFDPRHNSTAIFTGE